MMRMLLLMLLLLPCGVSSFAEPPQSNWGGRRQHHQPAISSSNHHRHLASGSSSSNAADAAATNTIELVECGGDPASIHEAAAFMVDAFWLGSGRQMLPPSSDEAVSVSDAVRASLLADQSADLMNNYGERLGQRLLESGILLARDNDELLGMVCLTETLLESGRKNDDDDAPPKVWQAADAETFLKETMAALGPGERRQYKGASAQELMDAQLLPDTMQAICCLSNLAVAPAARRRGVAHQLCRALETVAGPDHWGYNELHLLVEGDNAAARRLYEDKLGYAVVHTLPCEKAVRVSVQEGSFVETEVETVVMVKKLLGDGQ